MLCSGKGSIKDPKKQTNTLAALKKNKEVQRSFLKICLISLDAFYCYVCLFFTTFSVCRFTNGVIGSKRLKEKMRKEYLSAVHIKTEITISVTFGRVYTRNIEL